MFFIYHNTLLEILVKQEAGKRISDSPLIPILDINLDIPGKLLETLFALVQTPCLYFSLKSLLPLIVSDASFFPLLIGLLLSQTVPKNIGFVTY